MGLLLKDFSGRDAWLRRVSEPIPPMTSSADEILEFCEDSEGCAEFVLEYCQDEDGELMWYAYVRWEGVECHDEQSKGSRSDAVEAVFRAIGRALEWPDAPSIPTPSEHGRGEG